MKNKSIIARLKSKTPKLWLWVAGASASVTAMFTAGYVAVTALSIPMPDTFSKIVGITVFVSTAIAVYAKQKEVKP